MTTTDCLAVIAMLAASLLIGVATVVFFIN